MLFIVKIVVLMFDYVTCVPFSVLLTVTTTTNSMGMCLAARVAGGAHYMVHYSRPACKTTLDFWADALAVTLYQPNNGTVGMITMVRAIFAMEITPSH